MVSYSYFFYAYSFVKISKNIIFLLLFNFNFSLTFINDFSSSDIPKDKTHKLSFLSKHSLINLLYKTYFLSYNFELYSVSFGNNIFGLISPTTLQLHFGTYGINLKLSSNVKSKSSSI